MEKGYASRCPVGDEPGHHRSRESQQVKKSRGSQAEARGVGGTCTYMLSGGTWHGTQSIANGGDKMAGLRPKRRNTLWKGPKSLRPPSNS